MLYIAKAKKSDKNLNSLQFFSHTVELSTVQIYYNIIWLSHINFHRAYQPVSFYRLKLWTHQNYDHLPDGLIAQLGLNPVQAWVFQACLWLLITAMISILT